MNKKGNLLGPNEAIHFVCGITAIIIERRNGTVMFCFINTSRYPLVKDYRWHVHGGKGRPFYAETGWRTSDGGKTLEMQRLLTGRQFEEVDHIDGNGLNNCDDNLRDAEGRNQQNVGLSTRNRTGVKGWSANGRVRIRVGGELKQLGWTKDPQKAREIYDAACMKHHGPFAKPNAVLERRAV